MTKVSQRELIEGAIAGKVVSFPTDTVPALAAKPESAQLIFELKQRSANKPLILMAASLTELLPYVSGDLEAQNSWQQVAQQYWPGALTLVLPASACLPKALNPTSPDTIGIRVPRHSVALEILQQTGPLATTSANLSGQPSLTNMADIERVFPEVLVLNNSQAFSGSGTPSTVARWTKTGWQILRQGSIKIE